MKKLLKKIFLLESKKWTILLGVFFPLFVSHIYVMGCLVEEFFERNDSSKQKTHFYIGYFMLSLIGIPCSLAPIFLIFASWIIFPYSILIVIFYNFVISKIYFGLFEEKAMAKSKKNKLKIV